MRENNTLSKDTFEWRMHDGALIKPAAMRTTHLFYTVRMVFNALVPAEYRINGKVWALNKNMPPGYWRAAVTLMLEELKTRKDLAPTLMAELVQMSINTEKLQRCKIEYPKL